MRRHHIAQWLVGTAMTALVVAGAACGRSEAAAEGAPAGVSIGTENIAVVAAESLSSGPAISGTLAAEREATIRAQVAGAVLQVMVDQGSHVTKGATLARIDDRALQDAFLSARSALTTAKNAAERARRDLERYERLAQAGAIAERDLETARLADASAQSQLADAQARFTLAQKQVEDAHVRAPFTGVVSERSVSEGDIVQPGAALFTVVDPSSMRYEAAVPAAQLGGVKVGAPVSFTVNGYPGNSFQGRVARISPSVDPSTGQVAIVISVPNTARRLVAGLFADGRIASERHLALT
ncbi:MAG TPA: efflux RND transporter periplasmic adaptor subunit, partial [Gemmatimonadaceae bacterium]